MLSNEESEPLSFEDEYSSLAYQIRELIASKKETYDLATLVNDISFTFNLKILLICFEKLNRKIIMKLRHESFCKFFTKVQKPVPLALIKKPLCVTLDDDDDWVPFSEVCDLNSDELESPKQLELPKQLRTGQSSSSMTIASTVKIGSYDSSVPSSSLKRRVSFKDQVDTRQLEDYDVDQQRVFQDLSSRFEENKSWKLYWQSIFGSDTTDFYAWDLAEYHVLFA